MLPKIKIFKLFATLLILIPLTTPAISQVDIGGGVTNMIYDKIGYSLNITILSERNPHVFLGLDLTYDRFKHIEIIEFIPSLRLTKTKTFIQLGAGIISTNNVAYFGIKFGLGIHLSKRIILHPNTTFIYKNDVFDNATKLLATRLDFSF